MRFPEGLQPLSGGAWVALLVTAWVLWVSWRFNLHGSFQAYVYDKRYGIGWCCWGCRKQCGQSGGKMEESETLFPAPVLPSPFSHYMRYNTLTSNI